MTAWKLTVRTSPGALIAAEYECPVHGRFALDVPRGKDGDPPGEVACRHPPSGSAATFGVDPGYASACHRLAPHVISAPGSARVRKVEAVRGRDQKPEFSTWTDTQALEDGQDLDDWKDDRAKVWGREREREAMEMAREL